MIPSLVSKSLKWVFITALLALGCWLGLRAFGSGMTKRAATDSAQADVARGQSTADAEKGAKDVEQTPDEQKQIAKDAAAGTAINGAVAQDRADVARLSASPVRHSKAPGAPIPTPNPENDLGLAVESPRELAKDKLIDDLTKALAQRDTELADKDKFIATLQDAVKNYQAATGEALKADTLRKIALDAEASAVTAARLKGDFEGGVAGVIATLAVKALLHI